MRKLTLKGYKLLQRIRKNSFVCTWFTCMIFSLLSEKYIPKFSTHHFFSFPTMVLNWMEAQNTLRTCNGKLVLKNLLSPKNKCLLQIVLRNSPHTRAPYFELPSCVSTLFPTNFSYFLSAPLKLCSLVWTIPIGKSLANASQAEAARQPERDRKTKSKKKKKLMREK